MFMVPPTPEETPRPNRLESSAGASRQNFFARTQQDTPPPLATVVSSTPLKLTPLNSTL
ncbi:hypothetical protein DSO57_1019880 [Entomophthora muscae]|uniref:Uncharacterized protein n=1 Tax=Entomophthora muscae TaxID=34485 RepID=A0ACC2U2K0_9FUNG|nr:hypothetical protein DSO57_1019880 [Entomophthora muscae]